MSVSLSKSKKYLVKKKISDLTKLGGDSVIGGIFSGMIDLGGEVGKIKI